MRIVWGSPCAFFILACTPSASEAVLADILDQPHECWLEEQIHGDGEPWGDCYERIVWPPGCQDPTPVLDTEPLLAAIATYGWSTAPTFTITDAGTFEAFFASIPLAPDQPPAVDFATHIVAGIYERHSQCDGDGGEFGVSGATIYQRRRDASGTCVAQCDGFAEAVAFYAIPRSAGFPRFCIDELNTCDDI